MKRKQQHYFPITVTTEQATNTLKQAAEANKDQSLFYKIKDVDLIAKEFKYHDSCYKEFTQKKKKTPSLSGKGQETQRYSLYGDFQAVMEYIEEKILGESSCFHESLA